MTGFSGSSSNAVCLSPFSRLLLPAGKDGLVTKGFIFSCHQLLYLCKASSQGHFSSCFAVGSSGQELVEHEDSTDFGQALYVQQQCKYVHSPSLFCFDGSCLTQTSGQAQVQRPPRFMMPPENPRACAQWLVGLMPGHRSAVERAGPEQPCGSIFVCCVYRVSSSLSVASSSGQLKALLSATLCKHLTPAGKGGRDKSKSSSSGKGNERGKDGGMRD